MKDTATIGNLDVLVTVSDGKAEVNETMFPETDLPYRPPNVPHLLNPMNGQTEMGETISLSCSALDQDKNTLKFVICFGNITPSPFVNSNVSVSTFTTTPWTFAKNIFGKSLLAMSYMRHLEKFGTLPSTTTTILRYCVSSRITMISNW